MRMCRKKFCFFMKCSGIKVQCIHITNIFFAFPTCVPWQLGRAYCHDYYSTELQGLAVPLALIHPFHRISIHATDATTTLSLYIPNKLRLYYSSRIERGIRDRGSWPLARVRRGHAGEHQHSTLRSKVGRTLEGLATQHFCLVPLHVTLIGAQHSLPRAGRVGLVPSPSPCPLFPCPASASPTPPARPGSLPAGDQSGGGGPVGVRY